MKIVSVIYVIGTFEYLRLRRTVQLLWIVLYVLVVKSYCMLFDRILQT